MLRRDGVRKEESRQVTAQVGYWKTKMTLLICQKRGHMLGAVSTHLQGPAGRRLESK